MLRTPLKNSKNVNKQFKSPFDSPIQNKDDNKSSSNQSKKKVCPTIDSPLSTRTSDAKRVLLLDENEKNKRQKITHFDTEKVQAEVPQNVTKSDLLSLKRKIFEIRQELDCLKSRERCTKKHDPKGLKVSIDKWKTACQNALEIICSELTERNGQNSKITDVLNMLGIPKNIVHYSEKDDAFV